MTGYLDGSLRPNLRLSQTEFEKAVWHMIEDTFKDSAKFHIREERKLYNPQVSEYIWEQNKGYKPHVCEVYFDGEFVCDIASNMQPEDARNLLKEMVAYTVAKKIANARKSTD